MHISTHALTWSATRLKSLNQSECSISTHALTWSATYVQRLFVVPANISTHALTWSATVQVYLTVGIFDISTHALTWSATSPPNGRILLTCISTHALTWSATALFRGEHYFFGVFQLTRSRGARPHSFQHFALFRGISTHALTWSATCRCYHRLRGCPISTHALTWSATRFSAASPSLVKVFQLTRSRGARRGKPSELTAGQLNFNSRAHVERDRVQRTTQM